MSKILDNTTGSPINIADTGITVDNVTDYTIPAQDYWLWAASSDIITEIGAGNIVVNDGSTDLSISDGTDLIKGLFPNRVGVQSGDDFTNIGHIGDNLKVTTIDQDDASIDAAGRKRISELTSVFQGKFDSGDDRDDLFEEKLAGSGTTTHNSTKSLMELDVTTASGDRAVYQSKEYIPYVPGNSLLINATCVFGTEQANTDQRLMYGDDDNGVGVEFIGTTFNCFIRSKVSGSVVNNTVAQASWNLDVLDGTGASGVTLDHQANNIWVFDLLWLSAGRVRIGIEVNGMTIYFHEFSHSNVITTPYMQTATLPIRAELENTGVASGATQMDFICCAVGREGVSRSDLNLGTANMATTTKTVTTSGLLPLVSIRLNSSFKRAQIIPLAYHVLSTASSDMFVCIIKNASLTSPSWVAADGGIITQKDVSATALSGGTHVQSYYLTKGGDNTAVDTGILKLLSDFDGTTQDTLTIAARTFTGNAATVAALDFEEVF